MLVDGREVATSMKVGVRDWRPRVLVDAGGWHSRRCWMTKNKWEDDITASPLGFYVDAVAFAAFRMRNYGRRCRKS